MPRFGLIPLTVLFFYTIIEMYFAGHYMLIHQWGGYWSNRGYPGEKLNSKAVGGQLVWVDLALTGRLNGKINAAR